jgi:hypothetical protein
MKGLRPALFALLLALCLPLGAEPLYYDSDAAAFEGELLASPRDGGEYVLAVTRGEGSEARVLLHKGKEVERRLLLWKGDGRLERLFREGNLAEEDSYGAQGVLLNEKVYKLNPVSGKAELAESRIYTYSSAELGSRLTKVEAFDQGGAPRGGLEYRYDARARLVEIRASGSFGKERAGAAVGTRGLVAAWIGMGEDSVFVASYEGGKPLVEAVYGKDGKALSVESYTYGEGGGLSSTSRSDPKSGEISETSYDAGGRPVRIELKLGAATLSRRELGYDERGRLIEDALSEGDKSVEKTTSYAEEGTKSRIVTRKGGVIISAESVEADSSSVRELYDKGELFLRVYSSKGRVTREEFIREGSVVRVRVFP